MSTRSLAIFVSTLMLHIVDCRIATDTTDLDFNQTAVDDDTLSTLPNKSKNICPPINQQDNNQTTDDGLYCERTSDGYLCWGKTKAGERVYQACPFNTNAFAFKDCLPNGTWFRHPSSNSYWTNYTLCFVDQHAPHTVTSIFTWGYLISIIALLVSMLIFNCFRQLDCARVSIHKNLFLAYIVNGVVWIIEYRTIVIDATVLLDNTIWCRMVHVLTQYTTCCNYFWMFCEGFFMHVIIVETFTIGRHLRNLCYVIGWVLMKNSRPKRHVITTPSGGVRRQGIPLVPSIIYTTLRSLYGDDKRCWTGNSALQWIIQGPITLSLLTSLILGANILRIVMSKLRAGSHDQHYQTGRSVRATLILIPLLGLHYFIMPFKPKGNKRMEYIYNIISAILISFQGLLVAILFCFLNEEVLSVVRRRLHQLRLQMGFLDNRQSNVLTLVESTSFTGRGRSSIIPATSKQNGFETESMILADTC